MKGKKLALKKVALWDAIEAQRPLSLGESDEKVATLESFILGFIGRNILETKIKGEFAQRRDKNTRYFHRMANSHKRRNHINKLRINGEWATEESVLRTDIIDAF